ETTRTFIQSIREEYDAIRERRKNTGKKRFIPIDQARANKMDIDWSGYTPPKPKIMGLKTFLDVDYREIREFIDWTPYFQSWQLKGKYPDIFEDKVVGKEARKVYNDAQIMLDRIINEKWLRANAVIGFFPVQ